MFKDMRWGGASRSPNIGSCMRAALALFGGVFLVASPASAQREPGIRLCRNDGGYFSTDDVVFGCTAVVEDERSSRRELAWAYSRRGFASEGKGEAKAALADYDKAIELSEDPTSAYVQRGAFLSSQGEHDRASADYSKAIELSPNHFEAFARRGDALQAKGETDRALADYSKAIELDGTYEYAWVQRAALHLGRGEYDQAILDYTAAIKVFPKAAWAYLSRGNAYQAKGNHSVAIKDAAKALELEPNSPEAKAYFGLTQFIAGNFKDAIPHLRSGLAWNEQAANLALFLYVAQARVGVAEAATELERNAKALASTQWPYAASELFLGKRTTEQTFAATDKPEHRCEAHYFVGQWQLLKGDPAKAATEFKVAADSCPKTFVEFAAARAELQRLKR